VDDAEMLRVTRLINGASQALDGHIRWVRKQELRAKHPRTREPEDPRTRINVPSPPRPPRLPPTHSRT
jgi:hypothetical protein